MAIDELTDNALYELYQKDENVKKIVEDKQKRYGVHFSQNPGVERSEKEEQEHRKKVDLANKEIKETVKQYLTQQKQGIEEKTQGKKSSTGWSLPALTQKQAAVGLATIVLALAAVYSFGTAPLVATAYALSPLY